MKITVLGCGSSAGVPLIGNNWGDCDPKNPRNRRSRVSILVEQGATKLVVDTGPDFRQQMLTADVRQLDAVLYTHAHADHCHGIDELRSVNWMMEKPIDIYADPHTMKELKRRFDYVFTASNRGRFYAPAAEAHEINGAFAVGDIGVLPFTQQHGNIGSLGFRFGDFAYSTDVNHLDEAAFEALHGVKVWLVDACRLRPHPTHAHLELTMQWIERLKPQQAFLTHMNQDMDYDSLVAQLPEFVRPAHDGQVIEC